MSKRRRVDETNYYTLYCDPCESCIHTRDIDSALEPELIYNVIVFDVIPNSTIILATYCNRVKLIGEFDIDHTFNLTIHSDLKQVLLNNTQLCPDVINLVDQYARVYLMTYLEFKYNMDYLYGHLWSEQEKNSYLNDGFDIDQTDEHYLQKYLPKTGFTDMVIRVDRNDSNCLEINFETCD